jgi:CRP-like cAMP-binding protein
MCAPQVLQPLDSFGEAALVIDVKRPNDVRAATFLEMNILTRQVQYPDKRNLLELSKSTAGALSLSREDFEEVLELYPAERRVIEHLILHKYQNQEKRWEVSKVSLTVSILQRRALRFCKLLQAQPFEAESRQSARQLPSPRQSQASVD